MAESLGVADEAARLIAAVPPEGTGGRGRKRGRTERTVLLALIRRHLLDQGYEDRGIGKSLALHDGRTLAEPFSLNTMKSWERRTRRLEERAGWTPPTSSGGGAADQALGYKRRTWRRTHERLDPYLKISEHDTPMQAVERAERGRRAVLSRRVGLTRAAAARKRAEGDGDEAAELEARAAEWEQEDLRAKAEVRAERPEERVRHVDPAALRAYRERGEPVPLALDGSRSSGDDRT